MELDLAEVGRCARGHRVARLVHLEHQALQRQVEYLGRENDTAQSPCADDPLHHRPEVHGLEFRCERPCFTTVPGLDGATQPG